MRGREHRGSRFEKIGNFRPLSATHYIFWREAMKKENAFQSELIRKIKDRFTGSIVLKNDSSYKQGIPDLTVLYKDKWAALECKKDDKASHRPNQDYYISKMDEMSFARFISPENEEDILDEMDAAFKSRRKPRVSRSK